MLNRVSLTFFKRAPNFLLDTYLALLLIDIEIFVKFLTSFNLSVKYQTRTENLEMKTSFRNEFIMNIILSAQK